MSYDLYRVGGLSLRWRVKNADGVAGCETHFSMDHFVPADDSRPESRGGGHCSPTPS